MSKCYVGRCKCGRVVAAVVIDDELERLAKDVGEFIRGGLMIEQMDTEQVRVQLQSCACPKSVTSSSQRELTLIEEEGERGDNG